MNRRRKKIAFEVFYDRYRAAEVYSKILKVLDSCENRDQIYITYNWGLEVLNNLSRKASDYIDRTYGYASWKSVETGLYMDKRIYAMQDDLKQKCNQKNQQINDNL